ncbi:hypothetical protein A3F37_00540 [Candidatus Saccharibacteria bacterium RIFCSPHIGHO2_12_FULL_41_12]|nr:MAG: hypothetical protein A3F37_00540 [Candidatus Saccharibacteria bacterium RIFCSPHIGHO2_12_FULL_41_12]
MKKVSTMNAKSYTASMLFVFPTFALCNTVAGSDEFIAGFAKPLSLILVIPIIIWTARRLRNTGHSGWWTLALIPPTTILLLPYALFAPSKPEHASKAFYMFGIRAKGWRIGLIVVIAILLTYLTGLFITFLSDGL